MKRFPSPSLEDISPTGGEDLDERTALQHFLGMDKLEAFEMLVMAAAEGKLHIYLEDFVHMGETAFVFYFPALVNSIQASPCDFLEDAHDVIDCLVSRYHRSDLISKDARHLIESFYVSNEKTLAISTKPSMDRLRRVLDQK